MRILVDENVPRVTVDALVALGHDVMDIRGTAHHGADDAVLWGLAFSESRMLITTDKGFSAYRISPHEGVPDLVEGW